MRRILQIIPAPPGFRATFWDESSENEDQRVHQEDVMCLALVEENHGQGPISRIMSVLCEVIEDEGFKRFAEDRKGFMGLRTEGTYKKTASSVPSDEP